MYETSSPETEDSFDAPAELSSVLTWLHFGDLHITDEREDNYRDFRSLISAANEGFSGRIHFAVLPGDNADDGTEAQFRLVKRALGDLRMPVQILPGDHDFKPRNLRDFYNVLGADTLPKAILVSGYHCIFLDVVSAGRGGPDFRLGDQHLQWLENELGNAHRAGRQSVVFMHTYPADLVGEAKHVCQLFTERGVVVVDMGHTHYNELANDGRIIYAATRSTGQIEEGPVGFSISAIDGGAVSWRFKPLETTWPFVLITSPADLRLVTAASSGVRVARDDFEIHALAWSNQPISKLTCRINDDFWHAMSPARGSDLWRCRLEAPQDSFRLTVQAIDSGGKTAEETIVVARANYAAPVRIANGSDANRVGAWPAKGILGTQLGPNRSGKKW